MQYLFSTGLPRSGTTLFTKCMSANEEIMMAMGPNIEIYRFFRDTLVEKYGTSNLKKIIKAGSPIQDYFGSKYKIELLNLMLNSSLNENFDAKLWKNFLSKSISRVDHDSIDLIKFFSQLKGKTYKDVVINLLNIIKKQRKSQKRKYNGFNESWNICSFKTLAQAFPNSKFIIILRDPRAVWTSLNKNAEKREDLKVQLLSLSRHFRKYVILSNYYLSLPVFKKKLLIYRFEDFIKDPKKILKKICKFLGVKYTNKMLNVNNFFDFNTNKKWVPNSAFNINLTKLDKKVIYNWKNKINKLDLKTIEFLCSSELKSARYNRICDERDINLDEILCNVKKNYNSKVKWRTDLNNFNKDKELEILRYKILKNKNKFEKKLIQKCFLFKDYQNKFLKSYFRSKI